MPAIRQQSRRQGRGSSPPLPETSARMKAVRQRNTKPEQQLRGVLHRCGLRFRACPTDLPGRPDIANKSRGWCVFVHGCFWHGHPGCKLARLPAANHSWWLDKIQSNKERDARKEDALRQLGFKVEVVWQCQIEDSLRHFEGSIVEGLVRRLLEL